MKRPQTVFVVNNSGQDFRDQFDGEAFLFPADAKQAVEIPVEAATLIFGFGEESKLRCLQRLGWAPTSKDTQGAIERLGKFLLPSRGAERRPLDCPGGVCRRRERAERPRSAEQPRGICAGHCRRITSREAGRGRSIAPGGVTAVRHVRLL
jgi:hypothetical protein